MKACFFWVLAIIALGTPQYVCAQDMLTVNVKNSQTAYLPQATYPLALIVTLEKGVHINATSAHMQSEGLIPTELVFESNNGIKIKNVVFPKPIMHKPAFMEKSVPVYGPEFTIFADVEIGAKVKPGNHKIKAWLSFQGCNDQMCFMPEKKEIEVLVKVVTSAKTIKNINKKLF